MTTLQILQAAQQARGALLQTGTKQKDAALRAMADRLWEDRDAILAANALDMDAARGRISEVMLDRLALTEDRIAAMAEGVRQVAALPDPVGRTLRTVERPNGMTIRRVAVPMGVVAIIYESRPNVTSDAAALALKSGNVCVLRGGKEAFRSANAIVEALREGLVQAGLPREAVSLVQDTTRQSAGELMRAVGLVDLLIPRGGAGLIRSCVENALVPCIQTGTGICHVYVDKDADLEMALNIIHNAKTSRPSVCNAAEVCLVHRDAAETFLPLLRKRLAEDRPAACSRWSCVWMSGPQPPSAASRRGSRTLIRSFWTTFWPWAWWTAWTMPLPTFPPTPPATATASSPPAGRRRSGSLPWWTVLRCTGTCPPASPTEESLAWGARWASLPRSSMPGGPWGWRSCVPINM